MCTDSDVIVRKALEYVKPPYLALALYGSHARGDAVEGSDIDILQVTPQHTAPYTDGDVNITCYTRHQLLEMAKTGSLFIRHLLSESMVIEDRDNFLQSLELVYKAPDDYNWLIRDVTGCLPLVAISECVHSKNPFQYSTTAGYLLRSLAYAVAFNRGATSFAMNHISDIIGDTRPQQCLARLRSDRTYIRFASAVDLLFELTGETKYYREESLEAVVINSYLTCPLAVVLGLRILARGNPLTYA